jgi:GGDEF domain-containing protein
MASRIAASTDPLTGIANRGGFMLRGDRVVTDAAAMDRPFRS